MAFSDDFVGTSGTKLDARTGWSLQGAEGQYIAQIHTDGENLITDNTGSGTGKSVYICQDQGSADNVIASRRRILGNSANNFLASRIVDADNLIGIRMYWTSAAGLRLTKVVSGVYYDLITTQGDDFQHQKLELDGTTARFYLGGVGETPSWSQVGSDQTYSENTTETSQGYVIGTDTGPIPLDMSFDADVLSGGPTVIERTVVDGIYIDDPTTKTLESIKDDQALISDLHNKIMESIVNEQFLLFDNRYSEISIQSLDQVIFYDSSEKISEKTLVDGLFLTDEIYKILEKNIFDGLLLSDLSIEEIVSQNLITRTVTDYLNLSDKKLSEHEKVIFDNMFISDLLSSIQEKLIQDGLLLSDDATTEISQAILVVERAITDYLNLVDSQEKIEDKNISDNLLIFSSFTKVCEKILVDNLFLKSEYATLITGAVVEALVFAKLSAIEFLGEEISEDDNFLGAVINYVRSE